VVVVGAGVGIFLAVRKGGDETAESNCIEGYVYRMARPADSVCVLPATYTETQEENRQADSRRSPTGGPYGPNTCLQGFVWREAYEGDVVCVPGASRSRAREDNRLAPTRVKPPEPQDPDGD